MHRYWLRRPNAALRRQPLTPCRAIRRRPRRPQLRPQAVSGRPPSTATPTAAPPRRAEPSAVGRGSHTSPSPHRGTVAPTSPSPAAPVALATATSPSPASPPPPRCQPPSRHVTAAVAPPPGLLPTRRPAFSREERENVRGGEREKGWCGILTCGIHVGPTLRDKVSYISHSHPRSHFIVECHAIISYGCVRLQGLQQRCSLYEQ